MSNLIKIIAIAVLLSSSHVNAAIKSFNRSYHHPEEFVTYYKYAFEEGNLVYAVCESDKRDNFVERTCTVIQRQFPYDKVARSCDFAYPITVDVKKILVHPLGLNNVILFWDDYSGDGILYMMTVPLDSCKPRVLKFDDPAVNAYYLMVNYKKIVTYDSGFDVFMDYLSFSNGTVNNRTGWRINSDREPQSIFADIKSRGEGMITFMTSIATHSPDKGYIYVRNEQSLWMMKADGTKKLLSGDGTDYGVVSTVNNVITWCAKSAMHSPPSACCTQYDKNGDVKFNVTLDLAFEHDDKKANAIKAVHSSARGGFLLMTASVEKSDERLYYLNGRATSYDVVRVDGEGRKVGSVRLNGFVEDHVYAKTHSLWENENEYCAASIGQTRSEDNLNVVVNCFTEDDFLA